MLEAVWCADSDDGNDVLQARRLPDLARHADGSLHWFESTEGVPAWQLGRFGVDRRTHGDHSAQLSPANKKVAIKGGKCRLSLMQ